MFSHVFVGVTDFERAYAFYAPLMASLVQVDDAYRTALAHGGTSEGAPGPRPEYHADYYGAYVRDPDHNKLCVACHLPAPDANPTLEPVP